MQKALTLIALMLMTHVSAFAQVAAVPPIMNFQGRLTKPDGTPVPNGNYSIRFSLWTAATGGTEKWNQTINPVMVKNGTFSVPLNTSTGAADKFNNNLFLEIKIGTDAPLTPRQPLASVAYAMKANAVTDGSITTNSLANNAVTNAKIADNAITTSKLANGAITSAKLDSTLQGMLGGIGSDNVHLGLVGTAELGDKGTAVAASGNYAYVIAGSGVTGSLRIYDISNPIAPALKGSSNMRRPRAIAVAGNYAYVTTDDGSNLMATFDVSNPSNPVWKGDVPTGAIPAAIAISGNHLCVVNHNSSTLQVFSISNPATPVLKGSVATAFGPNALAVTGNHAFVTNSAGNTHLLQSFDISNSSAPVARGSVPASNPASVAVSGNYAYVAIGLHSSLNIVDISNRAAPTLVKSVDLNTPLNYVAVSGPYAFVAYSQGLVQVLDISDPHAVKSLEWLGCGNNPQSIAVAGDYVCMVDYGQHINGIDYGRLYVFDRQTLGIGGNLAIQGTGFFRGQVSVDQGNLNDGKLANGLTFGSSSGEGISSKRTPGGNQWGLDFYTDYQNRLSITNIGMVGIGTDRPEYQLDVDGNLRCIGFTNASDARYKQNIAPLQNPLESILNLRGVTYDWKRDEFPEHHFAEGRQIGFIAQEVEKVLPELVSTDTKGYKSVAYQNVVPVLVEAVKTQQKQQESDRAAIQAVKAENAALKRQLTELAELVRELKAAQDQRRAYHTNK